LLFGGYGGVAHESGGQAADHQPDAHSRVVPDPWEARPRGDCRPQACPMSAALRFGGYGVAHESGGQAADH